MEEQKDLPKPQADLPLPEKEITAKTESKFAIFTNKFFLLFVAICFLIAFLIGGFMLGKNQTKPNTVSSPASSAEVVTSTITPSPIAGEATQNFLEIPEYGVKFALTEPIKDAYYLPATADKGYVYLKVRSLDLEPQCKKDESSTAALSKVGKDDINEMSGMKYSDAGNGIAIGNYYYYIDLAQYECAESVDGKAALVKVRKAFSEASKTITKL